VGGPRTPSTFGHGASEVGDLGTTSMADYADDVVTLARTLRRPPILIGWSMGGLVAMMAAAMCDAQACVGLAPSTASRSRDRSIPLRAGVFGAEEYGIVDRDPDRQPSMADLDREECVVAIESLGLESRVEPSRTTRDRIRRLRLAREATAGLRD
jgi:pimeloyl-ACP methyl ester carboxylesterase